MKYTRSLSFFCLLILSACGQNNHKTTLVSKADSSRLQQMEKQSIVHQSSSPDSAIYFADQGLRLSRKLHYPMGEARLLSRLAAINAQYNNLKLAVRYQQEALNMFKELHDVTEISGASAALGILFAREGNFKQGETLISEALNQYEKTKNTTGMISAYTKLGEVSELRGDLKQALGYYTQAEKLNQGRPVSDDYFNLLSSAGRVHAKLGNYAQAAGYFEKGISQSGSAQHIKSHIGFLNNAGKAWDELGDKQKALDYHQRGLKKARANGLKEEEARSLVGIARVLKDQDAEQSIQHLKNALEIAHAIGHKQLAAEIYRSLSDLYRQQSRYAEAITALEEHHHLLDSLLTANTGHKIAVLQSSYELAESKLNIEALELANQEKTYQRNEGLFVAATILVILLILMVYFIKNQRLNQRLVAANLIKDKLFSIIGHDLRNPIGGIIQLLEVLEAEKLTDEQRFMVSEMRKQGKVSLNILNALLDWGEAQLKGITIQPAIFAATNSIAKNIISLQKHARDKNIIIIGNTPTNLMLHGDINHFEFIIRNLLSNAVKFSNPQGTIEVAAEQKAGSGQVIFSVTDHGKGISKVQQEHFEKSGLEVSFGTKGEKGTGIGLLLSKEFVKANGGRIWIVGEEGKGTTFYFTFPQAEIA